METQSLQELVTGLNAAIGNAVASFFGDHQLISLIRLIIAGATIYGFFYFLKNRIIHHRFIRGSWEGDLVSDTDDRVLSCEITISQKGFSENMGFFYYTTEDGSRNKIASGVDKLIKQQTSAFFLFTRNWTPIWNRVVHQVYGRKCINNKKVKIDWECKIKLSSFFSRNPKFDAVMTATDVHTQSKLIFRGEIRRV